MQQLQADTWTLPNTLQLEEVVQALATVFRLEEDPGYKATVVYADSFDWRLYRKGCLLHNHGRAWTLYHGSNGEITLQQQGPLLKTSCVVDAFPEGSLKEALVPLLGIRSLLPMATVHLSGHQIRLLNEDDKTVVRLVYECQQPAEKERAFHLLRLFSLRGYEDKWQEAKEILLELGAAGSASPLIGFEEGCLAKGRTPLDYSSKFTLELTPDLSAREAMIRIYQTLVRTMKVNLPGTKADLDTEFLHDLRVAIRRTRSGLSLVKKVLPNEVVDSFKKRFSRIGSMTGATRDLDVYLLNQQSYLERIPERLQPGLALFFQQLGQQRRKEQKKMAKFLDSKECKDILSSWKHYLVQPESRETALGAAPVGEVAGRIIYRRFKRVLRDGVAINAASPDDDVHNLRIQCKKLRYTIEFFRSLYPKNQMDILIRQLKKLQDILGIFNDLSVQQELVVHALAEMEKTGKSKIEIAAALGALLQSLAAEQQELRTHFAEAFATFSASDNTALFQSLFDSEGDK